MLLWADEAQEESEESEEDVLEKVNARRAAEGKRMITVKERHWLLQGTETTPPPAARGSRIFSGSRIGGESPGQIRRRPSNRKAEIEQLSRELQRMSVATEATSQVKEMLADEVAALNERIIGLEEDLQDERLQKERLTSRLNILALEGNEREVSSSDALQPCSV